MWGLATAIALRFFIMTVVLAVVLTWREAEFEEAFAYACFNEQPAMVPERAPEAPALTAI